MINWLYETPEELSMSTPSIKEMEEHMSPERQLELTREKLSTWKAATYVVSCIAIILLVTLFFIEQDRAVRIYQALHAQNERVVVEYERDCLLVKNEGFFWLDGTAVPQGPSVHEEYLKWKASLDSEDDVKVDGDNNMYRFNKDLGTWEPFAVEPLGVKGPE